jgi:hypothetical protein
MHEEARRLARLLVSEIKLYNEDEVLAGRSTHDIYERLREDIDRSRLMYEERIPPRVVKSTSYFRANPDGVRTEWASYDLTWPPPGASLSRRGARRCPAPPPPWSDRCCDS